MLRKLLSKDKFTLIILDACRYDSFEKIHQAYLDGRLSAVKSPSSYTIGWLEFMFRKYRKMLNDVKIFSANPYINSKKITIHQFKTRDYLTGKIVDVWKSGWSKLNTVPPDVMVRAVEEEGLENKSIIWFMQPHDPFIGKIGLNMADIFKCARTLDGRIYRRENLFKGSTLWSIYLKDPEFGIRKIRRTDKVSKEYISAYEENLSMALLAIKKFFQNERTVKARCIVTSDHGELLGESSYYGHSPLTTFFPESRIVPWFIINK